MHQKWHFAKRSANQIWELIPPFARYGFNKSHAACYAMIGYQTAYLKANYPEEFMAALLNAEMSDIERISFLIQEAKQARASNSAAGREPELRELHAGRGENPLRPPRHQERRFAKSRAP